MTSACTEHDITVTINAPRCAGHRNGVTAWMRGEVTEDTSLSTGGTLTISDDDAGEATFTAQTDTAGPYGTSQHRHRWRVDVLSE
ncbi:VCBS domain-containing protein [Vibrio chagasii]|nr:VCBS domain-containing protein [Vibrio chagasii]